MEHKSYAITDFKTLSGQDGPGTFEGLVSVFGNVDYGGDRVHRGAFKESLAEWKAKGRSVPILWSHDHEAPPIGVVTEAVENNEGLRVKGSLLTEDNPQAKAVYAAMKAGALHEFSFGYQVREFKDTVTEAGDKVRELIKLGLGEVSPVFRGMNPATRLMGVKSDTATDEIRAIDEQIAQLEATKAALEAVTDPPVESPSETEPDDNPEPNSADADEEATARIRRLLIEHPLHQE